MPNGEEIPEKINEETPPEESPGRIALNVLVNPLTQKIASFVVNFATAVVNRVWEGYIVHVFDPMLKRYQSWFKRFEEGEDEVWQTILQSLVEAGIMPQEIALRLKKFSGLPLGTNSLFNLIIMGAWLTNYVQAFSSASLSKHVQALNQEFSPNLPPSSSLLQAGILHPETQEKVREVLRKLGYSGEHIDLMNLSLHRMYDVGTAMTLYLRKELDAGELKDRLYKLGFTSDTADEMIKTFEIIPPVTDILTMVGKEAFEPDQIVCFGLDEEFPEAQTEWLEKQGLSRFWQEKYWAAHWNYPGPGQVLQMLHRELINEEDVAEFYRVVEMPRFWREKLMKVSFSPYTRVDVRRMHSMGVLTDEELIKAYKDIGYDQTHAEKLAEFTKRYNADAHKKLTLAQIIKAYRSTLLSRPEAATYLGNLGFAQEFVEWHLTNADFEETLENQAFYINAAKNKYIDGLWDDLTVRKALGVLNLPGARIEALITQWSTQRITDTKIPSKTDLDKFFRAKIISEDNYKEEMARLGYSWRYTEWYLKSLKGTTGGS
jgi:hypothetical protein